MTNQKIDSPTRTYKKPDPKIQKIMLGMIGERIVASYLRKQGHEVDESLNVFDNEKDMLVDGKNCEVKTQVPIMVEDSFAISPNQRNKVLSAHRVYWINVPIKIEDEMAGCVFEMNPNDEAIKAHRWRTRSGREMICFPRHQTAMKILFKIEDPEILDQLRMLSTSYL